MAAERRHLFAQGDVIGFSSEEIDFEKIIEDNYFFARRGMLEISPQYKQPICYGIISDAAANRIFVYGRSSSEHHSEARLAGKISRGLGG